MKRRSELPCKAHIDLCYGFSFCIPWTMTHKTGLSQMVEGKTIRPQQSRIPKIQAIHKYMSICSAAPHGQYASRAKPQLVWNTNKIGHTVIAIEMNLLIHRKKEVSGAGNQTEHVQQNHTKHQFKPSQAGVPMQTYQGRTKHRVSANAAPFQHRLLVLSTGQLD